MRLGTDGLLEYNADYKILICRGCEYAIQKSALKSHLLRHKIYRGDRQRLLKAIGDLDLLEPDEVFLPAPGASPVDGLPVFAGFRCTELDCRHLTVSVKRMRRHWGEAHGLDGSVPLSDAYACPVELQTFFRGTKVRYFEVVTRPLVAQADDIVAIHENGDDEGEINVNDNYGEGVPMEWDISDRREESLVKQTPLGPRKPPSSIQEDADSASTTTGPHSAVNLDLETLTYFHHFLTTTSSTLPGTERSQSSQHHWQTQVVSQALCQNWLMCGLLALAARHLEVSTSDRVIGQTHRERVAQFFAEFSTGMDRAMGSNSDSGVPTAVVDNDEEIKTGEQIKCLLRCAMWSSSSSMIDSLTPLDHESPSRLRWILGTIRGCITRDTHKVAKIRLDEQAIQELLLPMDDPTPTPPTDRPDSNNSIPPALYIRLRTLPMRLAERLGRPETAQEVFTTLGAITTTITCCNISFVDEEKMGSQAAWRGVAAWLDGVTVHFNAMVERNHPAALVVLSHWAAVLVRRAEERGCWWLKGSATMLIRTITQRLCAVDAGADEVSGIRKATVIDLIIEIEGTLSLAN